jgi:hypothetical protein
VWKRYKSGEIRYPGFGGKIMNVKEVAFGGVEWIHIVQDGVQLQAFVNTALNAVSGVLGCDVM